MADPVLVSPRPDAVSGLSVILDQAATAVALTAAFAALLTAAATGPWSRAAAAFQAPLSRLWPARLVLGLTATLFLGVQPLRLPLVARAAPPGSWLARGGLCRLHLFGVAALTWPLLLALAGSLLASPLPRGWAVHGVRTRLAAARAAKAAAAAPPASPAASSAPTSPLAVTPPPKRRWSLRTATAAGPAPPTKAAAAAAAPRPHPPALTLALPTRRTPWAAVGWAALLALPLAACAAALAWLPLDERDDGYGGAGVSAAARAAFGACERVPRRRGLRVDGRAADAAGLLLPDSYVDAAAPCGCVYPGALLAVMGLTAVLGGGWVALAARALARAALNRRLAGRVGTVAGAVPACAAVYTLAAMCTRVTPPSEGWPASAASLVLAVAAAGAAASVVLPLVVAPAAAARGARLDAEARTAARAARVAAVARAAAAAPGETAVSLLAGDVNENADADAAAAKDAVEALRAEKEAADADAGADADADAALAAVEAALAADAAADAAEAKRRGRAAGGARWWHALVPGARRRAAQAEAAAEAEEADDAATVVTSIVGGGGGGGGRAPGVVVPGGRDAWATESDEE